MAWSKGTPGRNSASSYYRARYYDPGVGRFLSEDPSGFNGDDVNLYRYAKESPPNLSDPSGLNPGAGSIPWPKVLPWPVASPWARAIGGWLGLLLSDLAWPDATNKEPQCDRRKDDPCYMQYMEDASWCADTFTGADDTLYNHCMAIAWFNYISCKEGRDRVKRDPRDYPKPTNRPVKKPNE